MYCGTSCLVMFYKKGGFGNFAKFTGKDHRQGLFLDSAARGLQLY